MPAVLFRRREEQLELFISMSLVEIEPGTSRTLGTLPTLSYRSVFVVFVLKEQHW